MPLAKNYDFKVQMYIIPHLLAVYERMKKKKFRMIDNPDRLQTEYDNWLCQSIQRPDYMLTLCHGIGPIWNKEEEVEDLFSVILRKKHIFVKNWPFS